MIYYVVWGLIAIIASVGCSKKKYQKISTWLIILIIVLFAGLRHHNRWTDYNIYYDLFMNYGNTIKDFEIGFLWLNKICRIVLRNYNIYLCMLYAVVLFLYYKEFKVAAPQMIPFCLFVFFSTMILSSGGQRQFIACGITFYSIKFIREKKLWKFIVCVCVAALIHRTALVFLVAYWLSDINIQLKTFSKLFIIGIIAGKLNLFRRILEFIVPFLSAFGSITYRIKYYASSLDNLSILSFGFFKRTLIMCMILFQLYNTKKNLSEDNSLKVHLNVYAIGYVLSLFVPGVFARLNVYFYVSEAIIEAMTISGVRDGRYRILMFIAMIILNLAIWINMLYSYYPEVYFPYRSCLFG